jgi:hypothetical protein
MKKNISRRKFIGMSAAATAGLTLGIPTLTKGDKKVAVNDKLNIGVIGTGDRGEWQVYILMPS